MNGVTIIFGETVMTLQLAWVPKFGCAMEECDGVVCVVEEFGKSFGRLIGN